MDFPPIASVALQQASTGQSQLSIAALKNQLQSERQIVNLIAESVQSTGSAQQAAISGRGGQVDILA